MRFVFGIFVAFSLLRADSMLSDVYNEINNLNLSEKQYNEIKTLIKQYHIFLRQWYVESKGVAKDIMEDFAQSKLSENSDKMSDSLRLFTAKKKAEQEFLMSLYKVLDSTQRKKLGGTLKKKSDSTHFDKKKNDNKMRYKL